LDIVATIDNMTTALGYMEYACEVSLAAGRSCWLHAVMGGMAMNCGGAFIRHFVARGYTKGVCTLSELLPNAQASFLCTCHLHHDDHDHNSGLTGIDSRSAVSTLIRMEWSRCVYYWLSLRGRTALTLAASARANGRAWQVVTALSVAISCLPPVRAAHSMLWRWAVTLLSKGGGRLLGQRGVDRVQAPKRPSTRDV
jgi:hypothetical protein